MTKEEKYAKILALSIIYEKDEGCRLPFVERISCRRNEVDEIVSDIYDEDFRNWVISIAHLFRQNT
jgi:hypothetical protein